MLCVTLLRKVPPCDQSASCRHFSKGGHTVAPLGFCYTEGIREKKKNIKLDTQSQISCITFVLVMLSWKWSVRNIAYIAGDIWMPVIWLCFCKRSIFTWKQLVPLFLPEVVVYRHNMALCSEDVLIIRLVKWVVLIKQLQCPKENVIGQQQGNRSNTDLHGTHWFCNSKYLKAFYIGFPLKIHTVEIPIIPD